MICINALNADGSLNIQSFAEKMKKDGYFVETSMDYRVVETSMDYRVVNARLSRMWRTYGVSDITKTSAGLFYFKFKNEEGKIFSGVGKPMLMDKLTKERCLKKSGKPDSIGKLAVKYQWQPPQCTHCKTFGHATLACKVRPRTKEEIAVKSNRNVVRNNSSSKQDNVEKGDQDGFIVVGKKNKNLQMFNKFSVSNFRQRGGRIGVNRQNKNGNYMQQNNVKAKGVSEVSRGLKHSFKGGNSKANDVHKKFVGIAGKDGCLVDNPPLSTRYNDVFKPKDLVRGSSSNNVDSAMAEDLPLKNAFQALDDLDMVYKDEEVLKDCDEEYEKVVWPKLKLEVEEVKSENEGMAGMMKPKNSDVGGPETDQDQVINLIRDEGYSFYGLLETMVKKKKLNRIYSKSSQMTNLFVEAVNGHQKFFCTFIYAHVKSIGRKTLWRDLEIHSLVVKDAPWCLLGDFNIILDPCKRSIGSSSVTAGMEEFRDCLCKIEVVDLVTSRLKFTWNKSPGNPSGLLKKLDRVMRNVKFLEKFSNAHALFLPFVVSDHTSSVINIPSIPGEKPKPFKFANFLALKPEFLPLGDLASNVKSLKEELGTVQSDMVKDPSNAVFRQKEADVLMKLKDAIRDDELFLKQRIKGCLVFLVSDCQSAFIPSRQISDNIMLTQELMRNYHRKSGLSK
ncbi:RNA-directed DNA polymerase, eukaryota, reverse transcriptase zinc-binding domain protein, partial [Tanacetum coccineum]